MIWLLYLKSDSSQKYYKTHITFSKVILSIKGSFQVTIGHLKTLSDSKLKSDKWNRLKRCKKKPKKDMPKSETW